MHLKIHLYISRYFSGNQAPGKQIWRACLILPCSSGKPAIGLGIIFLQPLPHSHYPANNHPSFFLKTDWQWCPLLSSILRENSPSSGGLPGLFFFLEKAISPGGPAMSWKCVGENELRAGGGGERGSQCNILVNTCHRVPPPASGEALCCSQLSRAKQLPSSRR